MADAITDVILGMTTLRKYRVRINTGENTIIAGIAAAIAAIDDEQQRINKQLGVSDELQKKHAAVATVLIDDEQRKINRQLGVSDELFKKYSQ